MDHARFDQRTDMVEAIEQFGTVLEWLAPYCPDFNFNPVEKQCPQAKVIRIRELSDVDTV